MIRQRSNPSSQQRGLSLIEMMIVMLLSALMLLMIVQMFTATRRSSAFDVQLLVMQENGRFAMKQLVHSLEMSGFFGSLLDTSLIDTDSATLNEDCGAAGEDWGLDLTLDEIEFVNDATSAASSDYTCLDGDTLVEGSDLIAVRYVSDMPIAAQVAGGTYLRGDRETGTLYQGTTPPALPTGITQDWRYRVKLFHVRDYSETTSDGIPTLCVNQLSSSTTTFETDCLADGIELVHFEFGVDSDDDLVVDYYEADPTNTEIRQSIQIRIYLLVRSLEEVTAYTNDKSYTMGSREEAARNDGFLRRVMTTSVTLRNSDKLKIQSVVN